MRNSYPSELQQFFTRRLCNVGSHLVRQIVNSILLFFEVFGNLFQLFMVEISNHSTTISKNFLVNNPIDSPPNVSHIAFLGCRLVLGISYVRLTNAQQLTSACVDNVQRPLLTANNQISGSWVVAMRYH